MGIGTKMMYRSVIRLAAKVTPMTDLAIAGWQISDKRSQYKNLGMKTVNACEGRELTAGIGIYLPVFIKWCT